MAAGSDVFSGRDCDPTKAAPRRPGCAAEGAAVLGRGLEVGFVHADAAWFPDAAWFADGDALGNDNRDSILIRPFELHGLSERRGRSPNVCETDDDASAWQRIELLILDIT